MELIVQFKGLLVVIILLGLLEKDEANNDDDDPEGLSEMDNVRNIRHTKKKDSLMW